MAKLRTAGLASVSALATWGLLVLIFLGQPLPARQGRPKSRPPATEGSELRVRPEQLPEPAPAHPANPQATYPEYNPEKTLALVRATKLDIVPESGADLAEDYEPQVFVWTQSKGRAELGVHWVERKTGRRLECVYHFIPRGDEWVIDEIRRIRTVDLPPPEQIADDPAPTKATPRPDSPLPTEDPRLYVERVLGHFVSNPAAFSLTEQLGWRERRQESSKNTDGIIRLEVWDREKRERLRMLEPRIQKLVRYPDFKVGEIQDPDDPEAPQGRFHPKHGAIVEISAADADGDLEDFEIEVVAEDGEWRIFDIRP